MMPRSSAFGLFGLVLLLAPSPAISSDRPDTVLCASGEGDARIAACTRLMGQTRLSSADRASVLYDRAVAYARAGATARAITDYSAALALKPDFISALNNRGGLFRSTGDLDRAAADFSAVIALDPKRDAAYVNRGIAYTEARKYESAAADFAEATRLAPDQASGYAGLCWVMALQGAEPERALEYCDTALRLQPDNTSALGYRALVFIRLNDFDGAIAEYDRCLDKEPQNAGFFYGRAIAKLRSGNPTGARQDFASANGLDPSVGRVFSNIGIAP